MNSINRTQLKVINKIFLLFIFFFPLVILRASNSPLYGDYSFKYYKNYSPEDYDYNAQNWWILQDRWGIIYSANQGGLLEFDGVAWHKYKIPNRSVRSMAMDEKGTIYIGGENQIGYLSPDQTGNLSYHSLVHYLKKDERSFSTVWKTYASNSGIFFQTRDFIFRWKSGRMQSWKAPGRFFFSYLCHGTLYVRNSHFGLMKIKDGALIPVPAGDMFKTRKIYMMAQIDSSKLIIGTLNEGFFLYDGNVFQPFPTEVDDYLRENQLYHGIRLSTGDFALGTNRGGLVIIDTRGKLKHLFSAASGLQDENVKYVYEDHQKNIWLALNKGIVKIEYNLPFSIYDSRSGLDGLILSISKFQNYLYTGTTKGLYILLEKGTFVPIPRIKSDCFALLPTEHSLLAATREGMFQIKGNKSQLILNSRCYDLFGSEKEKGRIWVGAENGIYSIHAQESNQEFHWKKEFIIPGLTQKITSVIEAENGDLWLGTPQQGVVQVQFKGGKFLNNIVINKYNSSNGLPDQEIKVIKVVGHIAFVSPLKGLYCFDEKSTHFIPDLTLGKEFTDGSRGVFRIAEDKDNNIWFHSKLANFHAYPDSSGAYVVEASPFQRIPKQEIYAIFPDTEDNAVWFGGVNGIIRFDTIKKNFKQETQPMIRKILLDGKNLYSNIPLLTSSPGNITEPQVFSSDIRELSFLYATPFFHAEEKMLYQTYLERYDNDWSQWSPGTQKDYSHLQAGKYCFWVRAKTVFGKVGGAAHFRFEILPHWYFSWVAITAYGILAVLFVYLLIKWRVRRLEKEKKKLEEKVRQSTRELEDKNRVLEAQTHRLQEKSAELKEMNKIKSRFFANISHEFRTPLTLIMAPLEKKLEECRIENEHKQYEVMLTAAQRLLNLINQLLELSKIDSGKQKIQARQQNIVDFARGVAASFQLLSQENSLNIEFLAEEENILLFFDSSKMEEILLNLLINSVKFTPAGGSITISIKKSSPTGVNSPSDGVEISIKDTGIGIPQDQLPHIFDRFYQAEATGCPSVAMEGTGIGLSLAKELIRLHHGNIDVHSTQGKGTEFIIVLPGGREHLKEDEIQNPVAETPTLKKSREISELFEKKAQVEKIEELAENFEEKNVILVVEDNTELRNFIRMELEPGYHVVEAPDGAQGLDTAKGIIPDLIISDIMMPNKDGIELCRDLKKDINTSHIPIILLTAKAGEQDMVRGLETGADDYITKPFNMKILSIRVKNLIELRHQLQMKIQRQFNLLPDTIPIQTLDDKFLKDLHDKVQANITDPDFNIDSLVVKMKMSRTSLFRKIKALTGMTPNEYILSFRLEKAAQMLKTKFGTVTDVAFELGFSSSSYFAKLFKEKFHCQPSTYMSKES